MWAVPTFIATTWWSWRTVRPRSTGLSARLWAWWLVGAVSILGSLAFATRRLADSSWDAPVWLLWGGVGGVLAVLLAIDVDVRLLPREVSLPAFVVVLVVSTIVEGPADTGHWGPLVGALVMTAITLALRIVSRGSLGMGDVLVSPLLGAVLGWFDPWAVVSAWLVAALAGGLGAAMSLIRGEPRQSLVAYGPFLIFGTAAALVVAAL